MYIFKSIVQVAGQGRKSRYTTSPDFLVFSVEKTRATGKTIAGFREVTGTGRARTDVVRIRSTEGALRGGGQKGEWGNYVKRTSAAVRDSLRRVRPEEVEVLARFDARIADLEEQLRQVRLARAEAAADAWRKAHVVTLKDVTEKIDATKKRKEIG